ncbi:MAG: hypothetical protein K6G26_12055 [Lachnospiraceae bacterium]|nr:hypothetical protein [Lachnospiraceae bacterium]
MNKKFIKATLIATAAFTLTGCALFGKDSDSTPKSTVIPHSGTEQKKPVSVDSNEKKWADYAAKLPRNFPEIKVNGSSDFNNYISEMGAQEIIWTNATEDDMNDIVKFLEKELNCKFEKEGTSMVADATIGATVYNINLSASTDLDPSMVSMTLREADTSAE